MVFCIKLQAIIAIFIFIIMGHYDKNAHFYFIVYFFILIVWDTFSTDGDI